jgi:serine/threonine protein phosphatase PrpC
MTPEWPLWSADHPTPAEPEPPRCPTCCEPVAPSASFCESCGAAVIPTAPAPAPAEPSEGSSQTQRLGTRSSQVATCTSCAGTIDADGYCTTCGTKAPSPEDHYRQSPTDWVGGVCDRGLQHSRNEDALALWAEGECAVLVVCDGVSSSTDADAASGAAVETIRAGLVDAVTSLPSDSDPTQALATAFVEVTAAANQAIIEVTPEQTANAPSATVAAAVVCGHQVHFANLGDSRVYFLSGDDGVLLSLDDSMAQAFIDRGMERSEAESLPRAHAITKWLGRDAVDIVPRVGSHRPTEPGWVVVCSDGLWNYASTPAELAAQLNAAAATTTDPTQIAAGLVSWANAQGGRDNITVALARCPAPSAPTTLEADSSTVEELPDHG